MATYCSEDLADHLVYAVTKIGLRRHDSQYKCRRWPMRKSPGIYGIDFSGAQDAGKKI